MILFNPYKNPIKYYYLYLTYENKTKYQVLRSCNLSNVTLRRACNPGHAE